MALLNLIGTREKSTTSSSQTQKAPDTHNGNTTEVPALPHSGNVVMETAAGASPAPENHPNNPLQTPPASGAQPPSTANQSAVPPPTAKPSDPATSSARPSAPSNRRWSFPLQFSLLRRVKSSSPTFNKHDAVVATPAASGASPDPAHPPTPAPALSSADRRAQKSALLVRSLIVGQNTDEGGLASPQTRISSAQLKNVKAQLLVPKTANKIITQLKALPALPNSAPGASQPIRAVCLPYRDEEADKMDLSLLHSGKSTTNTTTNTNTEKTHLLSSTPVAGAAIEAVTDVLRNLHVVSLFTAPNLGLGQPGDGQGLLAGAIPTAETVINGIEQITPQLMALSYVTGHPAFPDHKGIYPPTDRMSVLTCTPLLDPPRSWGHPPNVCCVAWWGIELLLPEPTLEYLSVGFHPLISFLLFPYCNIETACQVHIGNRHEYRHRRGRD